MKFIIGFLVSIGLLIVVFVLIFRGGNNADKSVAIQTKLIDYANSSTVDMQFTVIGPVVADENHDSIRMTVGKDKNSLEVFSGYQGTLLRSQDYPNNPAAYADFLRALQLNGYLLGDTDKKVADERGFCASGTRYIIGIKDGNNDKQRFWYSSCGLGSFKGKVDPIRGLFVAQFPDYDKQTVGIF